MDEKNYGAVETTNVLDKMVGRVFVKVINIDNEELHFITDTGYDYIFYHDQDCCETVCIEDIDNPLELLENSPITMAEEYIHENMEPDEWDGSSTYTFYKFATAKGYVNVRWCGSSNGYYSESVDFKIKKLSAED